MLGNIPINDNDEIEEDFLDFPIGTHKEDIWQWFDEIYPHGVYGLMYGVRYEILRKYTKNKTI